MPEGVYRLKKSRVDGCDKATVIEYCPDMGDDDWKSIESMSWNKSNVN